jgi:peptide/nickel transport system substrate-binding protein
VRIDGGFWPVDGPEPTSGAGKGGTSTRRAISGSVVAVTLVMGALAPGLGAGAPTSAAAAKRVGGIVTFAEPPGSPLNDIFPFNPVTSSSVNDVTQFQALMWRPLAWFGSDETAMRLDPAQTLYASATYSDDATVVRVTLKPYRWSDGYPLTSRDVEFAYDLYRYNKALWADYSPGEFPDNVASVRLPNHRTIVFKLTHSVNETWFTDDQLSLITPMPQHAWDRTGATSPVGNADLTASGAAAVFNYLDSEAMDLSTYATNPLWQVVDGPWRLSAFTADGGATFVPNPEYSGPVKPTISEFQEVPYSTSSIEVRSLASGGVDIGYLPVTDPGAARSIEAAGYRVLPWDNLAVAYGLYDFGNAAVGRILSQLYVRQAIQRTEDQERILRTVFGGYGSPTSGPVPLVPENALASAYERSEPDGFDVAAAISLLRAHGWRVRIGGTDVCERSGSGSAQCGAGILRGARLSFTLLYPSVPAAIAREAGILSSGAALAGIRIVLVPESYAAVVSTVGQCPSACSWQMALYGVTSNDPVLPTGEGMFLPGSPLNPGGYSDSAVTRAVEATLDSNRPGVFTAYENEVAGLLPWLWLPTPPYQLTMIRTDLRGVAPQNAYLYLTPEEYFFVR